ncbi:NAD(P)-binding protein [Tuber magnatum]|uniref:NAD(P)-binding protein n=1 Tax=Tuber magnatum TaxID=42249 RepID=A0A317T174_9PEZI|nr:NAD(P)-binding protein [Tuber magnatum]
MSDPPPQPEPPRPPRVWLITSASNPLGHAIALAALQAGESVAAGCTREEIHADDGPMRELKLNGGDRFAVLELDTRNIALCQSALAETVHTFHRVDVVLNCSSQSYIGTLEELPYTHILAQFEAAYFGPVNMMRSAVPFLRRQRGGHIVNVTGLTGHMGTPGLSVRCAGDHAVEGFSDALAYEIAPFNIKVTIVQPPLEVNVLSSRIHLTPTQEKGYTTFEALSRIVKAAPPPRGVLEETVSIITHIAALENPPGRIVVGAEGIEQVKDRLKTVSEELEEFLGASLGVDTPKE